MASGMKKVNPTLINQALNAIDRLTRLEALYDKDIGPNLLNLHQRVERLEDAVNAVAHIIGTDEVNQLTAQFRQLRVEKEMNEIAATFKKMVDDGVLVSADKISPKAVVLGRQVDEGGSPTTTYKEYIDVAAFIPEVQAALNGVAPAGASVSLSKGGKFLIEEAFVFSNHPVPKAKPVEAPPAAPEEQKPEEESAKAQATV